MANQANRSFRMFPTPEEVIQPNNDCDYLKISQKEDDEDDCKNKSCDSILTTTTTSVDSAMESSISSASFSSSSSSSLSDLMEDATSSSSSSNGPLFQLSDLMTQLPIKKGLSKYYEGKSESFTSLACVGNLEDLAKRENPYNKKKIKLCRNYFSSPKSSISKKSSSYSRTSSFSSSVLVSSRTCSNNFKASCRPPTIPPVQKDF